LDYGAVGKALWRAPAKKSIKRLTTSRNNSPDEKTGQGICRHDTDLTLCVITMHEERKNVETNCSVRAEIIGGLDEDRFHFLYYFDVKKITITSMVSSEHADRLQSAKVGAR
jgi:hypothetical protein